MKHQNGLLFMPGIPAFANWQRVALAAVFVAASIAQAQAVPLPRPAPKARDMQVAASEPAAPAPPAAINNAPRQPASEPMPNPIMPTLKKLFGGDSPAPKLQAFDANQRALADKVSAYLSSLQNLSGNFVQVGPDGSRTTGNFYLQKPGKIRFEYDDPSPIALVADGTSVIVRDRRLATQDVYPLSQTPLRYLLASKLDLLRDTNVTSISADDLYISITIEEKQAVTGTSRLTLMVGAKDGKLKQWTVTDPQGYDTTVAVYNLDTTKKLDPALFKIDYTNYQGGSN
ncbi:lipoprotein chaperone [Afipia felis]|uniref:Lipoprotein chaperone n=2 Tax=Afipia felis TaxID=1035 RepID=A0A090MRT1_AFIFE|nr:lipoprotein chaperone [Afipia felis]